MGSLMKRRPSPAMAVAFAALVAAMSGTAIALPGKNKVDKNDIKKGAVGKKQLKKNSVNGGKIKNNRVKGADVDESSLGQVPSAASATTATTATNAANAGAVNGASFQRFNYQTGADTAPVQLLSVAGLTLTATCDGGALTINATTNVVDSSLRGYGVHHGTEDPPVFTNNVEHESANGAFQPGEAVDIVPVETNDTRGYLAYYNDNGSVHVEYTADDNGGGPNGQKFECVAVGTALVG